MTTVSSGEKLTVAVPNGKALFIIGAHGTTGAVHRLNEAVGGVSASRTWGIGEGALEQIGPAIGIQRFLVICNVGSIDATVADPISVSQSVISITAPSNSDGRPENTMYIQTPV